MKRAALLNKLTVRILNFLRNNNPLTPWDYMQDSVERVSIASGDPGLSSHKVHWTLANRKDKMPNSVLTLVHLVLQPLIHRYTICSTGHLVNAAVYCWAIP